MTTQVVDKKSKLDHLLGVYCTTAVFETHVFVISQTNKSSFEKKEGGCISSGFR